MFVYASSLRSWDFWHS